MVKAKEGRERLEALFGQNTKSGRIREIIRVNRVLEKEICKHKETQKRLRALSERMMNVENQERHRISTYLHDQVIQTLVFLRFEIESMFQMKDHSRHSVKQNDILEYLDQTINDLKSLAFGLSPVVLYEIGFVPAVKWLLGTFETRFGIKTKLLFRTEFELKSGKTAETFFHSIRECLDNVQNHAQAHCVEIILEASSMNYSVEVRDDGVGFNIKDLALDTDSMNGFGLLNLRESLGFISGKLEIQSSLGKGTRILMIVPIQSIKESEIEHESLGRSKKMPK